MASSNSPNRFNPSSVIQYSPGVATREIDLTNFIPFLGISGGAFVGQFVWGPVEKGLIVSDNNNLLNYYGKPNDTNYLDWFSAYNFLSYANNLKIVRVVTEQGLDNYHSKFFAYNATADSWIDQIGEVSGILIKNEDHFRQFIENADVSLPFYDDQQFAARFPGERGNSIRVSMVDNGTYENWEFREQFDIPPGTSDSAEELGASNDEVHIVITDELGYFTGVKGAVLEKYAFLSKASDATSLDNRPIFYGEVLNEQSNYIWYLGKPHSEEVFDSENDDEIIDVEILNAGTGYTATTTTVEIDPPPGTGAGASAILGTNSRSDKVVFIAPTTHTTEDGVVADLGQDYTYPPFVSFSGGGNKKITGITLINGGQGWNSVDDITLIRVGGLTELGYAEYPVTATVANGSIDSIDLTNVITEGNVFIEEPKLRLVGAGTEPNYVFETECREVTEEKDGKHAIATAVLGGNIDKGKIVRYQILSAGKGYRFPPTVEVKVRTATAEPFVNDSTGEVEKITVTYSGRGYVTNQEDMDNYPQVHIISTGGGTGAEAIPVMETFHYDDWDQTLIDNITGKPRSYKSLREIFAKTLKGGTDGDRVTANEVIRGWETLRDPEVHDISLLFTGNACGESEMRLVNQFVIDNIVEYRKDCVVFCSPDLGDVLNKPQAFAMQNVIDRRNELARSSNYAVMDSGWKLQYDRFNDRYRWMPMNPDIAGLCAATDVSNDPWWSPAGYTRGRIKNCVSLAFNPNKTSRDELYKMGINPVATFIGDGTVLFGDKTLQYKPSAFSWINVRRLFIILKKSIAAAAKYYLFEFNDRFTRNQFVNMVDPFLREVRGRRGIYDYHIVCDETNNTGEVIDRGEFVANILIKPARSINFITLNFIAVKTGVDFEEVLNSQ
jgi:hypothetical protein